MDPNQQPNSPEGNGQPPQPQPQQPYTPPQPVNAQPAVPPVVPAAPQAPTTYTAAPQPGYDPNYLDSIAPPPPKAAFFSGSFGKIFFVLLAVFVLAVSFIFASSGKEPTADLQQVTVRLENISKTSKTVQKHLKSNDLSATNSNFQIWATGNLSAGEALLKQGNIKKTDYSKTMVASEKTLTTNLDKKFEDARLNATLNRVYARTMAIETEKLGNLLDTMAKKNKSSKIRDYAKNASSNLKSIQTSFDEFVDER